MFFFLILFVSFAYSFELPPIIVQAQRIKTLSTVSKTSLLTDQYTNLTQSLESLTSVHTTQLGSIGSATSIFIRGGNADHTLVLIDGLKAHDPSNTRGFFDAGSFFYDEPLDVDVSKGVLSALYGPQALGGVIHLQTPKGKGKPKVTFSHESGSMQTHQQRFNVQGEQKDINFNVSLLHFKTDGYAITPSNEVVHLRQTKDNPYDNNTLHSRLGFQANPNVKVSLFNRITKATQRYYQSLAQNPFYQGINRQHFHRLLVEGDFNKWKPALSFGYSHHFRKDHEEFAPFTQPALHKGGLYVVDVSNKFLLGEKNVLSLSLQQEHSFFEHERYIKANTLSRSLMVHDTFSPTPSLTFDLTGRVSHYFGTKNDYRLGVHYLLKPTSTVLLASYGTGFNAPSLYQLYHPTYGNRYLRPETSKGYELGLKQVMTSYFRLGTTYFSQEIKNLFEPSPPTWRFENKNQADLWGIETFVSYEQMEWSLRLEHTYLHAKERPSKQLLRRPQHKFAVTLACQINENWKMATSLVHTGKRADILNVNPFNRVYAGGYSLMRLSSTYSLSKGWQIFGRIENLLNKRTQEPRGYLIPAFSVYAGIKMVIG